MDQEGSTQPASQFDLKSLFLHWLVLGLVGMFLPIVIYFIVNSGYFIQWRVVAQAPTGTANLVVGDYGGLMVQTSSGQVLSCDSEEPGCWTATISPRNQTGEPCDKTAAAFSLLARSPENIVECIRSQGSYAEVGYTVLYARDQQGNIWKWEKSTSAYAIILLPAMGLAGGFAGVLVGSIVWAVRRMMALRKRTALLAKNTEPLKSKWVWMLAGIPLLCLVAGAAAFLAREIIPRPPSKYAPAYTSAAATVHAITTAEGIKYQTPATPNPANGYDFVDACSNSIWSSGKVNRISCTGVSVHLEPSIDTIQIASNVADITAQYALKFSLPADHQAMIGSFPVWEVRPGDHFKTVLMCEDDYAVCDMVLSVRLRRPNAFDYLGEWQVTVEQRSVEIDADLSRFTGERVEIDMEIGKYQPDEREHTVLLVAPRIEISP